MIIIRFMGGLGNQLFQYALYCKFQEMGVEVKIDDFSDWWGNSSRSAKLKEIGIQYETASEEEVSACLSDTSNSIFARIRRKILGRNDELYIEERCKYSPEILKMSNNYLVGYWQTEKYFRDIRCTLLDKINLQASLNKENLELEGKIRQSNAVSIHIRRGDYLSEENERIFVRWSIINGQ